MLTFVLGGARSGKSRFAESLCAGGLRVAYLATAHSSDDEMRARIEHHRARRAAGWTTVEEPLEIAEAVRRLASGHDFILLDCLTLWLSNWCWDRRECSMEVLQEEVAGEIRRLTAAHHGSHLVVVSNEIGGGLVPSSAVERTFRDLQGWVNQDVARAADQFYYIVAGIPMTLKRGETAGAHGAS